MGDNGNRQAIDPNNPPEGMFCLFISERMNTDTGQVDITIQGKGAETPYAIECLCNAIKLLNIKHNENKRMLHG